jgi:CBS domain-containing protein
MKITSTVRIIMTAKVVCANSGNTLSQVLQLFTEFPMRHLPVVDGNEKLVGIISSNDILKIFKNEKFQGQPINASELDKIISITDIMTPNPKTLKINDSISLAAAIFRERAFQALPVVNDENEIVGIVSIKDVLDYYVDYVEKD